MRLGDILVEQGALTSEALAQAMERRAAAESSLRLGEWLVKENLCTELQILQALAVQFGLPCWLRIDDSVLDSQLIQRLPVDWARDHYLLPVRHGEGIAVLTADPMRVHDQDDLALLLGEEVSLVLAPRDEILQAIERCYFSKKESAGDFLRALAKEHEAPAQVAANEDLLRMPDMAPVAQLVNLILLDAVKTSASDIHIEPYQRMLRMRFRIDGILYERNPPPKHLESSLISRLKVMAHLDIAEKRLPQDGTARVRVGEREIDIRVSTIPVADGERMVLRLLNRESVLLPLAALGMSDAMRDRFRILLDEPYGVIWVTGPTGSGKTTTLYAGLRELDTTRLNVLTIEDPVEYQLPTIGQMGVKPKIGLTFARGLRHILRQDPDVVLVGETRDQETAEIVVRASLTGHLVFSTLHTNDAVSAMIRLTDMGIEPYLVAASTRAALAQRLVRKLCPHCRQPHVPDTATLGAMGLGAESGKTFWKAVGCDQCLSGYRGRIGLYELLVMDNEMRILVRDRAHPDAVRRAAISRGMTTLWQDGMQKAEEGMTTLEEVMRVVGRSP